MNEKQINDKKLKELIENCPNISATGSLKGMYQNRGWNKDDIIVKYQGYYYNLSLGFKVR